MTLLYPANQLLDDALSDDIETRLEKYLNRWIVIFLKLTRTAKTFFSRFGWLLAELLFVFLGLYGAFLLEGYNDEKADLQKQMKDIKYC